MKIENPEGAGGTKIAWQKGSGTYLAVTGSDQFIGIYNRNGKLVEKIKISGYSFTDHFFQLKYLLNTIFVHLPLV